ncbi:MAG: DNA starvation/stationary phase protection protein [Acidobacteria bacterium]|nr:MAG: DNA starvation/stationary phase protection protein [Acidobacteriota bacterium]
MPEKTKGVPVDIGIGEAERREIAEGLARVVADTFTLYLMTHNFHWNVTGPLFPQLHALFEEQYTELWKATDKLAERVRALGFPVPATLGQFTRLTSIPQKDEMPAAEEMIRLLERLGSHEKAAWMLRSTLA